jgi:hypothetical protein|tara:strand:+ start:3549 stop:4949 length:1401 start_codon:yes stop_codon:yes gene_type:complete
MAQQNLNLGTNANDGTGDDLRSAMTKVQANFTDLYTNVNELISETAVNSQISFSGNKMFSNVSNADLVLDTSGNGNIVLGQVTIHDNEIRSNRSNDNLVITTTGTGTVQITGGNDIEMTATDDIHIAPNDNVILAPLSGSGDIYHYALNGTKNIWEQHAAGSWEILHVANGVNSYLGTGSAAFPTSGEDMWKVNINGHNTTSNYSSFGAAGQIIFEAGETWTASTHGTKFRLSTTRTGQTVIEDRIIVDVNGQVTIGSLRINRDGSIESLNSNQNITFAPNGTGAVAIDGVSIHGNEVRSNASNSNLELYGNGTGKVNFYKLYSFPSADGTADQMLKTDGSGNLSWTSVSGASLTNSQNADSTTTVSNSNATTIDTFAHATFRGGRYVVSIKGDQGGGDLKYETHDLLVTHDGTNAYFTQNSVKSHTGTDLCTFSVGINGSNFELKVINGGGGTTVYKTYRNLLNV